MYSPSRIRELLTEITDGVEQLEGLEERSDLAKTVAALPLADRRLAYAIGCQYEARTSAQFLDLPITTVNRRTLALLRQLSRTMNQGETK